MDNDDFIVRIFEKLDRMDERLNEMCNRVTQLETIHQVTKDKFNQLMGVIGAAGVMFAIVTVLF